MRKHRDLVPAFALVAATALCSAGCAPSGDDDVITADGESELVSRIAGSTLASPNVKAGATYLSARRVATLVQVGALTGAAAQLADRVDGIIANQPADGRYSVQELLQIEKPGFVETLFPEEKAALKRLWEMLETVDTAPATVAVAAAAPFSAVDLSTAAGAPIKPATLAIASLPAALQEPAERLELTRDADGDPTTVSEADLDAAIAAPGPYTPSDIAAFQEIKLLFVARAETSLSARVEVPAPFATRTELAAWGLSKLVLVESLAYSERRHAWLTGNDKSGRVEVEIEARHARRAEIELTGEQKVVLIDEATDAERVVGAGEVDLAGGATTIEVWSGGARLGSYRALLPELAAKSQRFDLRDFADYTFVAGGAPLFRNVVEATQVLKSWWNVHYGSESSTTNTALLRLETASAPTPASASRPALQAVQNPGFTATPGRYELDVPSVGKCQLDLFPEGVIRFTRPGGAVVRSRLHVWHGITKHTVQFPDRLRMIYDGTKVEIFFDGQGRLFDGRLTAAHRKG